VRLDGLGYLSQCAAERVALMFFDAQRRHWQLLGQLDRHVQIAKPPVKALSLIIRDSKPGEQFFAMFVARFFVSLRAGYTPIHTVRVSQRVCRPAWATDAGSRKRALNRT